MIGTTINDRYQIEVELGQGGMGSFYRAHDTMLDRDVAIKIISNAGLGTEGRAHLLNEARTIAKLNHPNIVTVHDVGEADLEGLGDLPGLTPFIVMGCVEGVNLYEQPPASLTKIIAITRQVCAALEHAHENGIIHRDLKPENVIVTPDGAAKLMDFGMARSVASRLTSEGTIVGTVFYLAPEQALGQEIDQRSDLYSLGVMLYELTTGELPFVADDPVAVITQHIHAPVVPPRAKNDQIPRYLNDLIVRLMSKSPDDRPDTADAVLKLLEATDASSAEILPTEELSVLDRIVRGRLVGRETEVAESRRIWKQAQIGAGQLLLISGEPGVGKSRLMREIVTQAEVGRGQAFIGESQAEGNAPYAAFAQITRRALRAYSNNGLETPNLVLAELIAIAPELQFDYAEIEPNPPLEPESERRRLFESVIRFVTSLSEKKPLLLVFEDLHWADSGTLALLGFLAQRTRELPVMLLGTYREVELDEALPFHETLLDLNRRNLGTRLKLERLDQPQTQSLLATIFAEEISLEFLAGIYQETEGNPFFVEEVCKALVESGELYFAEGEWHRPEMAEMTIPQSIKVAVQSRLTKLSPETKEILLNAAVIGREFDYETLRQVTGKDENTLIDGLEAALKAQLIEELKDGDGESFWFSHALIPAALRESLSGLRRTRLHRKVAQVFEEVHPEAYQRLAYHWGEGGNEEKGLAYTIKAADRAKETFANEDAIRLYSEALDLILEDHEDCFDLLAARAGVYELIADRDRQLADIEAMLDFANKRGDLAWQVDSLLALAKLYYIIDLPKTREPAECALEIAKQLGDIQREARAESVLGLLYRRLHKFSLARHHMEIAIDLTRFAKLNQDLAEYLSLLAAFFSNWGDSQSALSLIQEAVELSHEIEDKSLQLRIFRTQAGVYWSWEKYEEALQIAHETLKIALQIGDIDSELLTRNILGLIKQGIGLFNEAEAIYLEVIHRPDAFSSLSLEFIVNNLLALYRETAETEKGLNFVTEFLEKANQTEKEYWIHFCERSLAFLFFSLGKYLDGLEILKSHLQYIEKSFDKASKANFLSTLGVFAAKAGNFKLAYQFLEDAKLLCDSIDESSSKSIVLINSSYIALLDGKPQAVKLGLRQFNRGIEIVDRSDSLLSQYTLAGLHMKMIEDDQSHLKDALVAIEEAFEEFRISPRSILSQEHLHFLASQVYRVNDRIEEADDYLRQAYERVMLVAGNTKDDDLRCSYLENVRENREILKEAKARGLC